MAANRRQKCSVFAKQRLESAASSEFPEQAAGCNAQSSRSGRDVGLVAVSLLHQARVLANRDPPFFELAAVTVNGPQFHHDLVGVELDKGVDPVRYDQGKWALSIPRQAQGLAVEVDELIVDRKVVERGTIAL